MIFQSKDFQYKEYQGKPDGFVAMEIETRTGKKIIHIRATKDGETIEVLKNKKHGTYTVREATGEEVLLCEKAMEKLKMI